MLGQYLGRNTTASQLKGCSIRMTLPTNKLTYTLSLIENEYVDSVSMDSFGTRHSAAGARTRSAFGLHSGVGDGRALNEPLEGEFDGIGVVFNMATDTVIVLNVIPQGPERQGGREGRRPDHRDRRFAGRRA